jgi:hypothetical protein
MDKGVAMADLESQRAKLTEIVDEYIDAHPELISAEQGDEEFSLDELDAVVAAATEAWKQSLEELQSLGIEGIMNDMTDVLSEPPAETEESGEAGEAEEVVGAAGITQEQLEAAADAAFEGDTAAMEEIANTPGVEVSLELSAASE